MGTKSDPGAFDCYANAADDEPMFILLGRDKHAPTLVWLWSVLRELDNERPEVVAEARVCASEMMAWAHTHGRPVVGFGQAALAANIELIRTVNRSAKLLGEAHTNQETDLDVMRRFLAETTFEIPE